MGLYRHSPITFILHSLFLLVHYACWSYKSNRLCLQWDCLFLCEQRDEVFHLWLLDSWTKSQAPSATLSPPCDRSSLFLLNRLALSDHAAASFLTPVLLIPSFFFFFHTYSLNSALAPMGSLAWHWALCQGLGSDQLNRSTQLRPPTLGGSSYPRQPPGGKSQLPALQEAQSKHITGGTEGELTLPSSAEEVRAKPRPRGWAE